MRQNCEDCGEYKICNDEDVCYDCLQDRVDLDIYNDDAGMDEEDNETTSRAD